MVNTVGYAPDIDGRAGTQTVVRTKLRKFAFQPALMSLEKIIHLAMMQTHWDRQLQRPAARLDAQGNARGPFSLTVIGTCRPATATVRWLGTTFFGAGDFRDFLRSENMKPS
jgi:hypothetical protein